MADDSFVGSDSSAFVASGDADGVDGGAVSNKLASEAVAFSVRLVPESVLLRNKEKLLMGVEEPFIRKDDAVSTKPKHTKRKG